MGFKGKKGASLPPPPAIGADLDLGAGMDMGSLDLPSFDDLDKFALTMKTKEKEKEDFKPLMPKVPELSSIYHSDLFCCHILRSCLCDHN